MTNPVPQYVFRFSLTPVKQLCPVIHGQGLCRRPKNSIFSPQFTACLQKKVSSSLNKKQKQMKNWVVLEDGAWCPSSEVAAGVVANLGEVAVPFVMSQWAVFFCLFS